MGEEFGDGEDLDFREAAVVGAVVEAGGGGFGFHVAGGLGQGHEDAHLRLLPVHGGDEVADHFHIHILAALHGDHGLLVVAAIGLEPDVTIDPAIGALAPALVGLGVDEGEGPELELVLVAGGQLPRRSEVARHAIDVEISLRKGVAQAVADEADGQMGHVDANPAAIELFGRMNGGAAATKGIKHHIALVGGGFQDALQQGDGFLGGVAEAFGGLGVDGRDVGPNIRNWNSRHFIKITLETRHA